MALQVKLPLPFSLSSVVKVLHFHVSLLLPVAHAHGRKNGFVSHFFADKGGAFEMQTRGLLKVKE